MKLHTPSDQEFIDRMPPIPSEADTTRLLAQARARADKRQVAALDFKILRVEVYLRKR